jgi:hypothetical protein
LLIVSNTMVIKLNGEKYLFDEFSNLILNIGDTPITPVGGHPHNPRFSLGVYGVPPSMIGFAFKFSLFNIRVALSPQLVK